MWMRSSRCPVRLRPWKAVWLFLVLALPAWAGNFSVSPVRLHMAPRDRAIAITVENEGTTPLTVQAEAFAWSQLSDGKDNLVATEDLIISPPIVKIPPRGRQVLRLARIAPPDLANQLTYRLVVSEIPEDLTQKKVVKEGQRLGIDFYLAMSMPIFITPPAAKRELDCQFGKSATVQLQASCKNTGNMYAQVRHITFKRGEQELGKYQVAPIYILQGATRSLSLKPEQATQALMPSGPAQARLQFDDGKTLDLNIQLP
jgi:fimbrial chaperone protein